MYLEPITDRSQFDIWGRTAKAFFNVSDWQRINGNTGEVHALLLAVLGLDVNLIALDAPVITQHAQASEINQLIENIERLRVGCCLPPGCGVPSLPHDYQAGNGAPAPDYLAVNAWERNLQRMWTLLPNIAAYTVRCGVGACGQERFYQVRWR